MSRHTSENKKEKILLYRTGIVSLIIGTLVMGCGAAPSLIVSVPNIFLSHASGIQHQVVDFYEIGYEAEIVAPASCVWANLNSFYNFPLFFRWLDHIQIPATQDRELRLGDSFPYEATVVGKKIQGVAVITAMEKEKRLMMTLFSASRGSLEFLLEPAKDNTKVSARLTTELYDLSMIRPLSEVEKALEESLSETLKTLKLYCEGQRVMPEHLEEISLTKTSGGSVPFDVVKGIVVVNAPVEKVWNAFIRMGEFPVFYEKAEPYLRKDLEDRLDRVGDGIIYRQKFGDVTVHGTAVVTKVEPFRTLDLALFADFRGGAEFQCIPREDGTTEFSYLTYMQIPGQYKGKPVDRQVVLEQIRSDMNQILEKVKSKSEKDASIPSKAVK